MEYKSEIINFEKEDAESKKRMLGSDKVNIEELEREHEKDLLALEQEIEGWKAANRILKSHLEQAEKALTEFTDKNFHGGSKSDREDYSTMVSCADIYKLREALKSIQGDE